jgi:DNA-directed RNA polymerase subunit alpha
MQISTPTTIQFTDKKNNLTEVVIEPCYPGYGITIGNALRRVLLSSLPGSAVSAVKIDGVQHEYDTLDHVKEDAVEILMNLKKLRIVSYSEEPVTLILSAKGEKEVKAAEIKKNSDVDVINKDLIIATLTDKKANLNMEITVKQGMGYEPVEDRVVEKKEIGVIQIDALYSPIVNVGFNIEHVRVGQRTDYEKVILMLTTDGSTKPDEAIAASINILQNQFTAISDASGQTKKQKKAKPAATAKAAEEEEKAEEKIAFSDEEEIKSAKVEVEEDVRPKDASVDTAADDPFSKTEKIAEENDLKDQAPDEKTTKE